MRLIDGDALAESFRDSLKAAEEWEKKAQEKEISIRANAAIADFFEAILRVKSQPTVDAVKVIRCKDCIWSGRIIEPNCLPRLICGMGECSDKEIDENFFCADGRAKDAENKNTDSADL